MDDSMITEGELLDAARERLEELLRQPVRTKGIDVKSEGPDGRFVAGPHVFVVEAKQANRLSVIHQACRQARMYAQRESNAAIPLVVVPFMGTSGQRACAEAGVGFIDASGNVHVEAPGVFLHVEGKPNRFVSRGRPSSVFAPKSSRVARFLLLDSTRWWRQSELATASRLGRGYISRIVARLTQDGSIEHSVQEGIRPRDPNRLLDAWKDEYDFRRHRIIKGHVSARSGEELVARLVAAARQTETEYALTGLPAAALYAPFSSFRLVSTYLRKPPTKELLKALSFRQEDTGANTWLVVPNDDGVFDGFKELEEGRCVCPVQAFLDLGFMPERAKEAAEHLRTTLFSDR